MGTVSVHMSIRETNRRLGRFTNTAEVSNGKDRVDHLALLLVEIAY